MKNIVAAKNNLDQNGKRISNKVDGLSKKLDLASWYLADTFTPGTIKDIKKLDERTSVENGLRYLLGYRSRNFDMLESAGYKFSDMKKSFVGIRSEYASASYNQDDISGAYQELNNVYR